MGISNNRQTALAAQARNIFTAQAALLLPELAKAVYAKLTVMIDQPGSAPETTARRDAWMLFQKTGKAWVIGTHKAWKVVSTRPVATAAARDSSGSSSFQLMDNEEMEGKILASRLALRLADVVTWELSDLRLRLQHLEQISELNAFDVLRPEVQARLMVEQWTESGLPRDAWVAVHDVIESRMAEYMLEAYHAANEFLVQNGVMAEIDLRPLVKRTPSAHSTAPSNASPQFIPSLYANVTPAAGSRSMPSHGSVNRGAGDAGTNGNQVGKGGSNGAGSSNTLRSSESPHDETRLQTGTSPLVRARMRAQGVIGTLKRLISHHVDGFDDSHGVQTSPELSLALADVAAQQGAAVQALVAKEPANGFGSQHVALVSNELRQRTTSLKKAAGTSAEKATIEIVALMFQAILAEDRIPPVIRVWFARLQMPVLRVAISDPQFFGTLEHPARRLIDRMGSCVLGFDVAVSGSAMEIEVKRIVQVVEQYPETGHRVFKLVYVEFEKFLAKFLSEKGSAARVVSVAQQVEQKETMAIQYTIEMRKMLNDMPVREEIREFLFKIWAEVLALATMRDGAQHTQTVLFKQAASSLVWAASAKPNRADRAKVIADLPRLLALLKMGMTTLAMDSAAQEHQIKIVSSTLADAFMSKTDVISSERIDAMAKRLANLEDYLSDEDVGDLPLDTEALVMMIGIDASDIQVVTDGGSQPSDAMHAWVQELQLGSWFSLDHNGQLSSVQFAWRSERKQLHLFASSDGRHFLIQARRLAAYLQAGLLLPSEEEALTVRATRDALSKLQANPERLLG